MIISRDTIASWHVLVVDDEPDSLEIIRRVLHHHGATVYTAINGKQGLEMVQQVRPTFILSDLSMPGMDGWEMLHHLQENPQTADIPVVALTAHAMQGDRERALAVGFHNYLTKPVSPRTLVDDLVRLFNAPDGSRPDGLAPQ